MDLSLPRLFIIGLFSWICTSGIYSQSADSNLALAEHYYRTEAYDSAIYIYQSIADEGIKSPELQYNLGNCYFKKGDYLLSLIAYERALLLDPYFSAANYNLGLARFHVSRDMQSITENAGSGAWNAFIRKPGLKGWTLLCLVTFLALPVCILCNYRSRSSLFKWITLGGIVFSLSIGTLAFICGRNLSYQLNATYAIITEDAGDLFKSQAGEEVETRLSPGTKVIIQHRKEDRVFIRTLDGKKGWITNGTFEPL